MTTTHSVGTSLPQTVCSSSTIGAGIGGCATVVGTVTNAGGTGDGGVLPGTLDGSERIPGPRPWEPGDLQRCADSGPGDGGFRARFPHHQHPRQRGQFAGQSGSFQGQIPILASISISNGLQVQNSLLTTAYLFNGLGTTAVRNAANDANGSSITGLQQCGTCAVLTPGAVLRFPEGFAAAFKTRMTPTSYSSGAGTGFQCRRARGGTFGCRWTTLLQNIPAQFSPGSESASSCRLTAARLVSPTSAPA